MIDRFVNPWFLVGLAGVAIPVIIHILTRDRIRKVAFSTLRFFAQGARVTLRRKRWSELLVILLRILVCVLAALAFARPLFQKKDTGRMFPRARVIVVDRSASMARMGGAAFLASEVRKAVADLPDGAAVGLLGFDQTVRQWIEPGDGAQAVLAAAGDLAPGEGGTDFGPALKQANDALRRVNAFRKDIVLVSDLQRAGLDSYRGDWKLEPGVTLYPVVPAPLTNMPDVAIADAQVPQSMVRDNQRRALTVRVVNRGARDVANLPVVLRIAGREVARQVVNIPAGASLPVRFWQVFEKAGDTPVEIRVLCEDADPGDNVFYFNARVIPEIPVLLVGRSVGMPGSTLSFLKAALNPGPGTPFTVTTRDAATVRPDDVSAASVFILADGVSVPAPVSAAAMKLLERGGGVLLMPGDGVAPDAFWTTWSSLAPCRIKRMVTRRTPDGTAEGVFGKLDLTHPVLEIFQRPHHGDFSSVRFARYWDVTESQASRVLARFDDGRPAILERQVGQGICTIWLSPPEPSWNNLALRAIFLPLLHETVRQLAVRTEWPTAYTVGRVPPLPSGYALSPAPGTAAPDPSALGAGFHVLTNAEGKALCLAVNRPFSEADGAQLKDQELKAAFEQPAAGDEGSSGTAADQPGNRRGREWWWWLALALALLLPAELWVANRTARH